MVRFDNFDVPGPRQTNFEKFKLFNLEKVNFDNLDIPGPRQANLKLAHPDPEN